MARPFALVGSRDQWLRCAHHGTRVGVRGEVSLQWTEVDEPSEAPAEHATGRLAFDRWCRLYRSLPEEGRVVRTRWEDETGLPRAGDVPEASDLFRVFDESTAPGTFRAPSGPSPALARPGALAVTEGDRLFIAEEDARRVVVHDLPGRRLLRRVALASVPVDLTVDGLRVLVLLEGDGGVVELDARERTRVLELRRGGGGGSPGLPLDARRLAVDDAGRLALLDGAGSEARILFLERRYDAAADEPVLDVRWEVAVPDAAEMAWSGDGALVLARGSGTTFARIRFRDDHPASRPVPGPPLRAPGYGGGGLVRTPAGRVAYWTPLGLRHALPARLRYAPAGEVLTFRLDGGAYRQRWGRLFVDACVPPGTRIRARFLTADELPPGPELDRTQPPDAPDIDALAGTSPPMPPAVLWDAEAEFRPLHRRTTGREIPWAEEHREDGVRTFDAPVAAEPGRWLWVSLRLEGNGRATPTVHALRVERTGHGHLRRLPELFTREPDAASFLQRYLSVPDDLLRSLDGRATWRDVLLRADSAPPEVLPWLAGFVGLVLDERWPEEVRRTAVAEAVPLFRSRGTLPGLRRFLEIYAGEPVILVEHYRLRGMGGGLLGDEGPAFTSSILGGGFRVGGDVGVEGRHPLEGGVDDAFRRHAHRFTVLLARHLDEEEEAVVDRILELHRPAHTVFDVCTVDSGIRVGQGLHVGLSSIVGRSGGFRPFRLGADVVGARGILGSRLPGTRVGGASLGRDSEVG